MGPLSTTLDMLVIVINKGFKMLDNWIDSLTLMSQVPKDENSLEWVCERLRQRYPVDKFMKARQELDPNNILVNDIIEKLFPAITMVA